MKRALYIFIIFLVSCQKEEDNALYAGRIKELQHFNASDELINSYKFIYTTENSLKNILLNDQLFISIETITDSAMYLTKTESGETEHYKISYDIQGNITSFAYKVYDESTDTSVYFNFAELFYNNQLIDSVYESGDFNSKVHANSNSFNFNNGNCISSVTNYQEVILSGTIPANSLNYFDYHTTLQNNPDVPFQSTSFFFPNNWGLTPRNDLPVNLSYIAAVTGFKSGHSNKHLIKTHETFGLTYQYELNSNGKVKQINAVRTTDSIVISKYKLEYY